MLGGAYVKLAVVAGDELHDHTARGGTYDEMWAWLSSRCAVCDDRRARGRCFQLCRASIRSNSLEIARVCVCEHVCVSAVCLADNLGFV